MALLATKLATDLGAGVREEAEPITLPDIDAVELPGRYLAWPELELEIGGRKRASFTDGPELDSSDLGVGPAHAPLVSGMLDLEPTEEIECACEIDEEVD